MERENAVPMRAMRGRRDHRVNLELGRHVVGVAGFSFGLVALAWPRVAAHGPVFVYAMASAQIAGGVAIAFRRTATVGAVVLGAVYLVFAALCVPRIVATPQIYDSWGNFFEQFSLATGAALVYAQRRSPAISSAPIRIGRIALGICVASFTLEQAIYLGATAALVPKWLPPSQTFWALATTVAFALAAVALVANRMALLATRLLTLMIASFGIIVWVPLLLSDPHSRGNWSETVETFAISGTAWVLAELLGATQVRAAGRLG